MKLEESCEIFRFSFQFLPLPSNQTQNYLELNDTVLSKVDRIIDHTKTKKEEYNFRLVSKKTKEKDNELEYLKKNKIKKKKKHVKPISC